MSAGPAVVAAPHGWLPAAVTICIGSFLALVNANIVIAPLSAIEREFNVLADDASWISIAYKLGLAVAVPIGAWLGDRFGLRRVFVGFLFWVGVSSLLCGLAWDLPSLIAFRVLQAVPGAILPVTCMTTLFRIMPPSKLVYGVSLYAGATIAGPALSPLLGGVFTEYVTWRWVFYLDVPFALIGIVAAMTLLPMTPAGPRRRLDLAGYATIALSLFAFSLAIQRGQDWGWTSYKVLALLVVGVNALVLFIGLEIWVKQPLLSLRVFRFRAYAISLVLLQVIYTGMQALVYFLPLFLLSGQQQTPANSGLWLVPQGVVWTLFTVASGPLFLRYGPRWLTIGGLIIMGVGSLLLTEVDVDLPRTTVVWLTCLTIAGLGLCLIPALVGGTLALPPALNGDGLTFRNMIQRVTGAFSLSALTTMTTVQQAQLLSDRSALLHATGADVNPAVASLLRHGPGGLLPLFQELSAQVTVQTYSNVFLLVGVVMLLGAALAYVLPWGRKTTASAVPVSAAGGAA